MENKKKKKQSYNYLTVYVLMGAVVAFLMALLGSSVFLRVNSIVVEGIVFYTPEQVAEASGIQRGDSLFYLSKNRITRDIVAELPYINSVQVRRSLPDTLVLEVEESNAVAYIAFSGEAVIIDSTGRVLDKMRSAVGTDVEISGRKLIEIRGVPINEAEPGRMPVVEPGYESNFLAMRDILDAMVRERVAADVGYLDVGSITNISFSYMDMYRVILGGIRDMRDKLNRLPSEILKVQERFQDVRGTFNMSYQSGDYRFQAE